ncbi:hypothetical protein ACFRLW_03245 [Streptomyces sp. NPDC056728]
MQLRRLGRPREDRAHRHRAVAPRAVKLMGRLLDAEGRAVGYGHVDVRA